MVSFANRRRTACAASLALVASVLVAVAASSTTPAAAVEVYPLPSSGSVTVIGHGNGHGHGMSQYGARGAAVAGLNATQIVQFYYPGTALGHEPPTTTLRVLLSNAGGYTCVQPTSGLTVPGVTGSLPVTGISRYRLVPSGSGLALQKGAAATCGGSAWTTVASGIAAQASFASSLGYVVVYLADGTYTAYRGMVGAVRSGSGEITVNRVGLDDYTMGVAPRESPASWPAAAVQAQAIAARTYADDERQHAGGASYDICDSDNCQVYGGMTHYSSTGSLLWSDDPAALSGNSGVVLAYAGSAAFTQYSASDGGWTVAGGQPYLVAQADSYDNAASGDPYLNWSATVPVSSIASAFGLSRATKLEITVRDGHGSWGGRVTAGYVDGVDTQGIAQHVAVTGFQLQSAMGLMSNWFTVQPSSFPIGHLDSVTPSAPHVLQLSGWTFDPDHTNLPGRYIVSLDGVQQQVASTSVSRPDVQTHFQTPISTYGFAVNLAAAPGAHTGCLYAVDQDGLGTRMLLCTSAYMPDPLGTVDSFTPVGLHGLRMTGWSFDPTHNGSPGQIQVTVDGAAQPATTTTVSRPDVQQVFRTGTATLGFDLSLTLTGGSHLVCVLGIDQNGHGTVPLKCSTISIAVNPLGNVEHLSHVAQGYSLSGWAFDPDQNGGSTKVEVFLSGHLAATFDATAPRPDVQQVYQLSNDAVGFSGLVSASTTAQPISIVVLNTGPGADTTLVSGYL